jgi:hypothetical protein
MVGTLRFALDIVDQLVGMTLGVDPATRDRGLAEAVAVVA